MDKNTYIAKTNKHVPVCVFDQKAQGLLSLIISDIGVMKILKIECVTVAGNDFNEVWFQQEGEPTHYGLAVTDLLTDTFLNRSIGKKRTIVW